MQQLYRILAQDARTTKAQALRQAQLSLLRSQQAAGGEEERAIVEATPMQPDNPPRTNLRYSHPYYWAPFILIGNGL